jgi:YD repeat-containing protein
MRRYSIPLLALVIGFSGFLASCASSGPSVASAAATQKVRKERTVTVKVPVLVKESSYYSDGQLDGYIVYKYDPTNKFLIEKDSYDASLNTPMERVVSEWKNGLLADDIYYNRDSKVTLRHDYGYDAAGRLLSDKVTDGKAQSTSSSTYDYDAAGNKIRWRAFDGSGLLKAVTDYSYGSPGADGKSQLLLIDMKDPAGVSTGTIKLSYDPDGKLLRRDYLNPDGSIQKSEVYVYASSAPGALVAMELRRADGSLAGKTVYENGDLGQVLTATDSDGSGAVRGVTKYEYMVREDSVTQVYYE